MVVNIQTKHDALSNFFNYNYGAKSVKWNTPLNMGSTYARDWYVILIPIWFQNYKFLWFLFQFWFHHGWFRFWLQFQGLPKSMIPIPIPVGNDSNSDSNSNVSQITWFQFWFWFQHHVIPIPIRFHQARLWFRFWFRFRNHLQLCPSYIFWIYPQHQAIIMREVRY